MEVDGSSSEVGVSQRRTTISVWDKMILFYNPIYSTSLLFCFFDLQEYVSIIFSFYLYFMLTFNLCWGCFLIP